MLRKFSRTLDRNRVLVLEELEEKTNVLIWGLFTSTTMKASLHLGPSYDENLAAYRNTSFDELNKLFDITQKVDLGTIIRNSECGYDDMECHNLDEIYFYVWRGDLGVDRDGRHHTFYNELSALGSSCKPQGLPRADDADQV